MISSEVQRTLVKSPPELWAEVSDPAALARHLGELGEIRITRIEPEQLVEWEAENRTGTVQIKPSGWGTRVTLTVATEVPDASAPPGAPSPTVADTARPPADSVPEAGEIAPEAGEVAPGAGEVAPGAGGVAPEAGGLAPAVHEPLHSAEEPLSTVPAGPFTAPEGAGPAADAHAAHAADEPAGYFESVPSPLGAPLTAAAASSWPHETGSSAADASDRENPIDESASASQTGDGEAAEAYDWLPYEQPEQRRGFFARLFRRRRRPAITDAEGAAPSSPTSQSGDPIDEQPPARDAEPSVEADVTHEPWLQAGPALEPEAGAPEAEGGAPEPLGVSAEADDSAGEPEDSATEPEDYGTEPEDVSPEPEGISPQPTDDEPTGDMAGEPTAAEEIAEAEVTAVLTSVLDRLGAAHHRPFSRS